MMSMIESGSRIIKMSGNSWVRILLLILTVTTVASSLHLLSWGLLRCPKMLADLWIFHWKLMIPAFNFTLMSTLLKFRSFRVTSPEKRTFFWEKNIGMDLLILMVTCQQPQYTAYRRRLSMVEIIQYQFRELKIQLFLPSSMPSKSFLWKTSWSCKPTKMMVFSSYHVTPLNFIFSVVPLSVQIYIY